MPKSDPLLGPNSDHNVLAPGTGPVPKAEGPYCEADYHQMHAPADVIQNPDGEDGDPPTIRPRG
jgi:hypothetical protein